MTDQAETTRKKLGQLADMSRQCDDSDKAIRKAAAKRLAQVRSDIDAARRDAITDESAGEKYQELVLEGAKLERLLSG